MTPDPEHKRYCLTYAVSSVLLMGRINGKRPDALFTSKHRSSREYQMELLDWCEDPKQGMCYPMRPGKNAYDVF